MGDTDRPTGQAQLAPGCLAASTLRATYYRPLVRLAALLTGDADAAEAVVCEALAALRPTVRPGTEPNTDALRDLQRQVLVRSRRSRPAAAGRVGIRRRRGVQSLAEASATDFAFLPVVRALQDLPRRGREAVVLSLYLDLTEQQAALIAGVTPAALRRVLDEALRTLNCRLPRP